MNNFYESVLQDDFSRLPSYQEDPALFGYSRMNYTQWLNEYDPIALMSARKPSLDEQEGDITY